MKVGGIIFAIGAAFFILISGVYWLVSRDPIGTTALALCGGLAILVAFYVLYTSKRLSPMPEDRMDAEIDEADPEYGFYSPHSWWPLFLGFACVVVVFGLVFAVWLIVLGVVLLMLSIIGWMFEYYRGDFAQ